MFGKPLEKKVSNKKTIKYKKEKPIDSWTQESDLLKK